MNDVRHPPYWYASEVYGARAQSVPWHIRRFGLQQIQPRVNYGEDEVIAILDTGITKNHPEFAGRIVGPKSFVGDNDWSDRNGHGTATASVAAGASNGVAPRAKIMPVKVLNDGGAGADNWITDGWKYAVDNGATVVSMSLGGNRLSKKYELAKQYAQDHNVPSHAASGNEGRRRRVSSPGFYVVCWGAMDENLTVAWFSNGGEGIDLVAPGVSVQVALPDGQWQLWDGTSFACPHGAGTHALLLSGERKYFGERRSTNDEAIMRLQANVVDLGAPGYDWISGRGFVDFKRLFYEYLDDALLVGDEPPPVPSESYEVSATGVATGARLVGVLNPERVSEA